MDFFGDHETETPGQNTDSVEADVLIDTTIENAWALVSEPGWWINDGPLGDHDVEHGDDEGDFEADAEDDEESEEEVEVAFAG